MRVIVFLMATALLCAGCTEDKPREPDPTTKPSPTATVPSMPPEAEANTVDGAIAFVEHYVDVFNYASNTGDVKELQKLSDPKCEGCTEYIDLYENTYKDGGYYRDSEWELASLESDLQEGQLIVFGTVDVPAGRFKTKSGSVEQKGGAERSNLTFVPTLEGRSWRLQVLALQAESR